MEIGTIKLSAEQAQDVIDNALTEKGGYAIDLPKTNGCIRLQGDATLRKLPVKFRGGDKRSKAFRLKGDVRTVRRISRKISGKFTMDISVKD
jgi:hypothetical protein